jgi:hypothetical protein
MGEAHLCQIFRAYADYYNRVRTHLSLEKDAPLGRPVQAIGSLAAVPLLGGLHHEYVRKAQMVGTACGQGGARAK